MLNCQYFGYGECAWYDAPILGYHVDQYDENRWWFDIEAGIPPNTQPRYNVGYFDFSEEFPCVSRECCDDLPLCEYNPLPERKNIVTNGVYTSPPDINGIPFSTVPCTTGITEQDGGFDFAKWHLPAGYTYNILPCTDGNSNVHFKFGFHSPEGDITDIPVVYSIMLCPLDPSYIRIDSPEQLLNLLVSGTIPSTDWLRLLYDICGHYGTPGIRANKYILNSVINAHEGLHAIRDNECMDTTHLLFNNWLDTYSITCENYLNQGLDPTITMIDNNLNVMFLSASDKYYGLSPDDQDVIIQNNDLIEAEVRKYWDTAKLYILSQDANFPVPPCSL